MQYAIDDGDGIFAPALHHLLGRRRERLADATLRTCAARLESRLDDFMRRTAGACRRRQLQRVIKRIRRHLFVFITNRATPPTSNGSERALRVKSQTGWII